MSAPADLPLKARLLKERLKQLPIYHGQLSLESLVEWHRHIDHFASLAQLNDEDTIEVAVQRFAPTVHEWFQDILRTLQINPLALPPPAGYPFTWRELKANMKKRFSPTFAVEGVWRELENLKRGKDVYTFHDQFLKLARLVGGSRAGAERGSRLYMVYTEKMTNMEHVVLEGLAMQAHRQGEILSLHDAMSVVENHQLRVNRSIGTSGVSTPPANPDLPFTSSSHPTAPAPMDLSLIETHRLQTVQRERSRIRFDGSDGSTCARCGGKGHWSSVCPTSRGWRAGMAVAGKRSGSGGRGRPSDPGPNFNNVESVESAEKEEEREETPEQEVDVDTVSEDESGNA
jgi:hypothetical protein